MELETVSIELVNPRSFRPVLEGWYRQKGDADCPCRGQIQPFLVPRLAANAILLGVEGEDYTYRLVGENIRQVIRHRLKGLKVREVLGDTDYYRAVAEQLRFATSRRVPLYSVHRLLRPEDGLPVAAWRIVMPYREGDAVTRLLTYQVYDISAAPEPPQEMREMLPQTVFRVLPPA